jgi:RHS repeat-associated protein
MPAGTPSQATQYVYGVSTAAGSGLDSNDLLARVEQPDPTTGAPSSSPSNQESYTYNQLGDVLTATDPNGTTHTDSYDVLGRQVSDAVTTLGAGVDGSVLRHTTAYNALGLPYLFTSDNAASGGSIVNQVEDVYNGLGQLTGEYQEQTGAVNTSTSPEVRYVYTEMAGGQNNSRLTQMVYPNGRAIDFVYNPGLDGSISRLSAIADDNNGSPGTVLEAYTYLGLDTIVQYAHPQTGINLTYIQQAGDTKSINNAGDPYVGLDRFGRVIDQNWVNTGTGASTDRSQYAYDRSGDVLSSNNLVNPAESTLYQANGASANSAYDPLGRLTAFARGTLSSSGSNGTRLDTITSPSASQSWSLDSVGNWSGVTTDGSTTTQTFNAQDQATSSSTGAAPTFDSNGNTTSDAGLTFVYNAWDQLVSARNGSTTVASYAYDALGRRITETYGSGSTDHLYYSPDWQVIEERQGGTAASDVSYQYVWGAGGVDQLVLRDAYSGGAIVPAGRLYAQRDANGDVTALVNTSGQVVERYLYDPYGSVTVTNASWTPLAGDASAYGWRYLFQGGRIDTATGWYDFRNRDLIPAEGRWAERDPLGLAAGDPNEYRFVGNDPTDATDPSGLEGPWADNWHHLLPKQVFTSDVVSRIEGLNIDAKEYGWMLKGVDHQGNDALRGSRPTAMGIHPEGWNKDWADWLERHKGQKITKKMVDDQLADMKNMTKYKKYFNSKIGRAATMCNADWNAYLDARRKAKAAKEAAKAAKAAEAAKAAKTASRGVKLLKNGGKLGRGIPGVGIFFAVFGWGLDVNAKGAVAGTANSAIDAIPFVGGGKIIVEIVSGKDLIPDK